MGVITVITSGKGGVGKSTVTAGLAYALTQRGRRVLVMDTDAGLGCLDQILDIAEQQVFDLADVVSGAALPAQAVYSSPWAEGLSVLPAPGREDDIVSPSLMRQLCSALSRYYDHILIDCPAGIGLGFQSAIAAAQRALVVSTPDPVCLRNSARTRLLLQQAGITQQRLVVNRFSSAAFRSMKAYDDLDAVIDASGIQLIAVIPEDFQVPNAFAHSVPAPQKSPAAMAFGRLAARLEGEQIPLAALHKF